MWGQGKRRKQSLNILRATEYNLMQIIKFHTLNPRALKRASRELRAVRSEIWRREMSIGNNWGK